MAFNERVFNILLESKNTASKECAKNECNEECDSFQDTIGNGHNFDSKLVPDSVRLNKDSVPVHKECGDNECGDCCKEEYYIDARILDIYMEDNNIHDDAEAVFGICEYYGIDPHDMIVVIECDEINKGLIKHAKEYVDCGLLRRCHDQIRNLLNAGLRVAKRS